MSMYQQKKGELFALFMLGVFRAIFYILGAFAFAKYLVQ